MKTYTAPYITYTHNIDLRELNIVLGDIPNLGTAPSLSIFDQRRTVHELKDSSISIDGNHILITGYQFVPDYELYDSDGSPYVSPKLNEDDFNKIKQKMYIPKWAYDKVEKLSFWDRLARRKVPYYNVLNSVYYKLKPEPVQAEYYVFDNIIIRDYRGEK